VVLGVTDVPGPKGSFQGISSAITPELVVRGDLRSDATVFVRPHRGTRRGRRPAARDHRSARVSLSVVDGRIRHMLLTKRTERQEIAADRDDVRARTVPGPTGRCWPTGAQSAWQVTDETQGRGLIPRSKQR
jgi:hypothetical protein